MTSMALDKLYCRQNKFPLGLFIIVFLFHGKDLPEEKNKYQNR